GHTRTTKKNGAANVKWAHCSSTRRSHDRLFLVCGLWRWRRGRLVSTVEPAFTKPTAASSATATTTAAAGSRDCAGAEGRIRRLLSYGCGDRAGTARRRIRSRLVTEALRESHARERDEGGYDRAARSRRRQPIPVRSRRSHRRFRDGQRHEGARACARLASNDAGVVPASSGGDGRHHVSRD